MTQEQKTKNDDNRASKASDIPPAGPHAKPSLTDHEKTPGAGSLPDGDSKDVTPGQQFEYNKDPHGVIYAIIRRDLETGQERTLTARPGGSITPRCGPLSHELN